MDITVINNIWRPVYGMLIVGMRNLTPEWANLKAIKDFSMLSPRSMNWPVELVQGGGIAFTEDGGSTARATSNEPPEARDVWTHQVGRFEISFDALRRGKSMSSQEIKRQVTYQAQDKLRSFRRSVAMGFYGYPDAVLFHATGANKSNPSGTKTRFDIDDLYGEGGTLSADTLIRDYLTVGKDRVNVHSGETAALRNVNYAVVTDIDETNNRITVDSGAAFNTTIADGDAVILANHAQTGKSDRGMGLNGLLHLTKASTVHNIATSSYPDWSAGVSESGYGAALRPKDLYRWFKDIENRSMHPVQWIYTTVGVLAAAGGGEIDQRRYGASDNTMRIGFTDVMVMGVKAEGRPYCPPGHLFLGSNSAIGKIAPDEDVRDVVDSGDVAGGFMQYQNQLGFYKDQVMRSQIVARSRLGLGVVSGITEA